MPQILPQPPRQSPIEQSTVDRATKLICVRLAQKKEYRTSLKSERTNNPIKLPLPDHQRPTATVRTSLSRRLDSAVGFGSVALLNGCR